MREITDAVSRGETVHWKNSRYTVIKDRARTTGKYRIACDYGHQNANFVGLFWRDGITTDYAPKDFFLVAQ